MKMKNLYAALSGAFLPGPAALVQAQSTPAPAGSDVAHPIKNAKTAMSADYKADHEKIEADAKAAKDACKSLKANAKDICMAEAKGKEKVAMKELEAKRKGTPESQYDVAKAKAEA